MFEEAANAPVPALSFNQINTVLQQATSRPSSARSDAGGCSALAVDSLQIGGSDFFVTQVAQDLEEGRAVVVDFDLAAVYLELDRVS